MEKEIEKSKWQEYAFTYGITVAFFITAFITTLSHKPTGILLFLPIIFIVFFILKTQRIIEALFLGNFILLVMTYKNWQEILVEYANGLHGQVSNPSFQFVLLAASLIGGVTAMMGVSGGAEAVESFFKKHMKNKKMFLFFAWVLSGLLFITEFLQIMLMGSVLTANAKEKKISKERLTYIIKSMGVPMGVLVPTSIWSVFIISQFEAANLVKSGEGMGLFLKTIPLNFFAIISVLISLLVTVGVIPLVGKMKKAEVLAEQEIFSEGVREEEVVEENSSKIRNPKIYNFVLPLVTLVGLNIILDFNSVAAGILTITFTTILYVSQGLLTPKNVESTFVKSGVGDLITVFIVLLLGLFFADGLINLGFIDYLITVISTIGVPAAIFPVILFLFFAIVEFSIFLNWTLFILIFPIVGPLSESLGANMPLSIAAIISAVVFGSNTSYLSDSTLIISPFTNTKISDHLNASLPYQLVSLGLAAVAFLVAGFVLT